MAQAVYEIQGYAIVLNKICFLTRVFKADNDEGFQFNIRFADKLMITLKYPTRHEAELQRGLLLNALKDV